MAESSTKPYLIRAIHEWCSDNGYTPYIAVAVDSRAQVPIEHVRNGEIVLNVSAMATNHLRLGNDLIEFQARFGGVPRELSIPVENVTAIYARENGHGMAFEVPKAPAVDSSEAAADGDEPAGDIGDAVVALTVTPEPPSASKPPQLVAVTPESSRVPEAAKGRRDVPDAPTTDADDPERPDPTPGKPRQARPKLTRIK